MTLPLPSPWADSQAAVQRNLDALAGVFPVDGQSPSLFRPRRTVTSLPPASQAFDGMEVYYVADSTNGVTWHLKYKASEATYKWHFVGGPPLSDYVDATDALVNPTNNNVYGVGPTAGPSVTAPLAGDYMVHIDAGLIMNGSVGAVIAMSYDIGGTGAVDADAISLTVPAAANTAVSSARDKKQAGIAASTAFTAKYKYITSIGSVRRRTLSLLPIRVI